MRILMLSVMFAISAPALTAQSKETCVIRAGERVDQLSLDTETPDCGNHGCHQSDSDMPWSRWTGLSAADLAHEGHTADAVMLAEAGEMRCVGTVHDGTLRGDFRFISNPEFVARMKAMGFGDPDSHQLEAYARMDITAAWVSQMKDAGVTGLTSGNMIGLKALKVDPEYVRAMAAAGYPELRAGRLTGMKAVGISPAKVQAIRAMGYQPTVDELVQMSVFKIDAAFVERMKARGFKDPTIAQLIRIKTFKLDE